MPGHGYFGGVRLLHVCSVPRCPNLTEGSRCAEHVRGSDRRSRAYRKTRELVLERDRHACQAVALGASATECSGRLECHHILDVQMGGTDDPENMVAVCLRHNNMARRAKPPRWARDLELLGPPALRAPAPARDPSWPPRPWR
jgi:hypothetical protein